MLLRRLEHTALVVRDLERARWFYGEVLGLAEVARPASFTFRGCWFRGYGFELHLILADDTTAPAGFADPGVAETRGLAHHLAFEVADLAAAEQHLRAHGVAIVGGPLPRGDGVAQLYIHDPDGHLFELFTWRSSDDLPAIERSAITQTP